MAKDFNDILVEVFDNDEPVYLDEAIGIPAIITKSIGEIVGGAWKLEDSLRKSMGQFGEINFRKFLNNNKKKLEEIRNEYNLEEDDFNKIVESLISALRTNDIKKIKKEIKKQKNKFKAEDQKRSTSKEDVVDDILKTIFSEVDQNVVKLQKSQKDALKEVYKKYGDEIKDEILDFRKEILRPYNILRRQSKRAESGSPYKERLGVTRDQWDKAIKTGRNKIKKRGTFDKRVDELQTNLNAAKKKINAYEEVRRILSSNKELNSQQIKKLDNRFDTFMKKYVGSGQYPENKSGDEISGDAVRKYISDIKNYYNSFIREVDAVKDKEKKEQTAENAVKSLKNYINKLSGKYETDIDVTADYDPNLLKAIETFYFREDVRNKLKQMGSNVFKEMYMEMMNESLQQAKKSLQNIQEKMKRNRGNIDFNEVEQKVWGKKKSASDLSDDLDDYYLKIKEKDFEKVKEDLEKEGEDKGKESIEEAKNKIKQEIEEFKKDMKQKLEKEDFESLEKAGLFKTVKLSELVKSDEAIKDKKEIESEIENLQGDDSDET